METQKLKEKFYEVRADPRDRMLQKPHEAPDLNERAKLNKKLRYSQRMYN